MEPDHLVLDEPFAGLDAPARASVLDRLRALSESGTGVVIVTHDLRDVLDLADRVIAMADGRVVVDEAPETAVESLPAHGVRVPGDGGRVRPEPSPGSSASDWSGTDPRC
jgi:biotin transport system ATP-binding protein